MVCQGSYLEECKALTLLSIKNKYSRISCLKCSFGLKEHDLFLKLKALNEYFKNAFYDSIFKEWSKRPSPIVYNRYVKYF